MRVVLDGVRVDLPGGLRALDDVSVTVPSGTVTAVIGPSGAGKSTLLRVVAGLATPDAGRVLFDDDDVTALAAERRRLGVVFQDLRLFDFLTARGNVEFAPRVAGVGATERRALVDDALARVRAERFAERPASVLSGGERQRVAVARALAMRPRALLLDEPFAALDAALRREVREELRALVAALGLTALLVTHDRDDAFALASRFVVLLDGRVAQAGEATELYAHPASVAVATLLGEASLVPVEARGAGRARVGGVWLSSTGAGERALLRPEMLRLAGGAVAAAEGPVSGAPGWPARVVERQYRGGHWRVSLDAGPLGRLVADVPERPGGDDVTVLPPPSVHTL